MTNDQRMTKPQCPKLDQNSSRGRRERRLVIGHWAFFGHWALVIKATERKPGLIQRQWGRGEGGLFSPLNSYRYSPLASVKEPIAPPDAYLLFQRRNRRSGAVKALVYGLDWLVTCTQRLL